MPLVPFIAYNYFQSKVEDAVVIVVIILETFHSSRQFEAPSASEGISAIYDVPFVLSFKTDADRDLYMQIF